MVVSRGVSALRSCVWVAPWDGSWESRAAGTAGSQQGPSRFPAGSWPGLCSPVLVVLEALVPGVHGK